MVRLAKKRDRLQTDLKLGIPERESLGKAVELRTAAAVEEGQEAGGCQSSRDSGREQQWKPAAVEARRVQQKQQWKWRQQQWGSRKGGSKGRCKKTVLAQNKMQHAGTGWKSDPKWCECVRGAASMLAEGLMQAQMSKAGTVDARQICAK